MPRSVTSRVYTNRPCCHPNLFPQYVGRCTKNKILLYARPHESSFMSPPFRPPGFTRLLVRTTCCRTPQAALASRTRTLCQRSDNGGARNSNTWEETLQPNYPGSRKIYRYTGARHNTETYKTKKKKKKHKVKQQKIDASLLLLYEPSTGLPFFEDLSRFGRNPGSMRVSLRGPFS